MLLLQSAAGAASMPGVDAVGGGDETAAQRPCVRYYVADEVAGASDSNDGLAPLPQGGNRGPWKTVEKAAGPGSPVAPCDTVDVANGTYNGTVDLRVSGSPGMRITFLANGTRVVIDGKGAGQAILLNGNNRKLEWIAFDGFEVAGADTNIDVTRSQNITLRNLRVHDALSTNVNPITSHNITIEDSTIEGAKGEHGIYCSNGCDDLIVRNNTIRGNNWTGIQVNSNPDISADKVAFRALIENNVIEGNGAGGAGALTFASVRDSVVRNNLLKENLAGGIILWAKGVAGYGSKGNAIVSNTVVFKSGVGRYGISLQDDSTSNTIVNNVVVSGSGPALQFDGASAPGTVSDRNIFYRDATPAIVQGRDNGTQWTLQEWRNLTGRDVASHFATPAQLFADATAGDYHLRAQAPAIDSGDSAAPSVPAQDLDSKPRSDDTSTPNTGAGPLDYYDIGAYEFPGIPPPPPKPLHGSLTPDSSTTHPNATLGLAIRVEDSISGVGVPGANVSLDDGGAGGGFSAVADLGGGDYGSVYNPTWHPATRNVTLNASLSKAGFLSTRVSAEVRVVINGTSPPQETTLSVQALPTAVTNPANVSLRMALSDARGGKPVPAASVTINDGGAGGRFDPVQDHGNGSYSTIYRPPTVAAKVSIALNARASKSGFKDSFDSIVVEVRPVEAPPPPPEQPMTPPGQVIWFAAAAVMIAFVLGVAAIALLRRRRPKERYRAPTPAFRDSG
jgi:hypothetical protein